MNKVKKIPMRKCVVTQERTEKRNLMRIVRTPEGEVCYDPKGKMNGRGVYLSKSISVIEKARKSNVLQRHLDVQIPEELYQILIDVVKDGE